MELARTQVPSCVRCDKRMWHVYRDHPQDNFDLQPSNGLVAIIRGNYGSTYYDPFPGDKDQFLVMNICDECVELLEARNQIRRHRNSHGK